MAGVGLSDAGRAQAEALAAALGARPIEAVIASPAQRARETALPLAARLGLAVTVDAGLDEIDFGVWTGRAFAELDPDPAWQDWNRVRSLGVCPGGESMLGAQARAVACLCRLAAASPAAELALVSHQDVIKAVLAHVLGLSLDHLGRLAIDPASRTTIALSGVDACLLAMNVSP